MSKNKDMKEPVSEGIKSDEGVTEINAPKAEQAPAVAETSAANYTVKGGIDMVAVGNPQGASGTPASLRSVGGGARSPSSDYSRSPDGRNVRGGGANPLEKIDIRKEEDWNEIGAAQLETQVEAQPAGFEAGTVKGNYPVQSNPVFQTDNARSGVGQINKPTRVRAATMSKDVIIYARGQNDNLQNGVVKYPTSTVGNDGTTTEVVATRKDRLLRGIEVTITNKVISGVSFDTVDVDVTSEAREDLDTRADHARIAWEITDEKVSNTFFEEINKPENLKENKYSPLADGFEQCREHILVAEDIAAVDGVIATLGMRCFGEAYGLHRYLRTVYGSGKGAVSQAQRAFIGMSGHMEDSSTWAIKPTTRGVPTATAYVTAYLDSPTKYRDSIGCWFTQARGVLKPYQDALAKFDEDEFFVDVDSLKAIKNLVKWQEKDGKLVGIGDVGVIIPYDPDEIFEYNTSSKRLVGKYNIVDYVMNGNLRNGTNLCSPLFQGIILGIQEIVLPKISSDSEQTIYIPLTFSTDMFTYGNMFLLEGIARAFNFNLKSRGVFTRYLEQYGTHPFVDDITSSIKMADVLADASFKGLGADANFAPMNKATQLIFATPETIDIAASADDDLAQIIVAFDQMGQRGSGKFQFGYPILNKGARLEAYDMLMQLGAPAFLASRDQPLYRPGFTGTGIFASSKWDDAPGVFDEACPFFSVNASGQMAGNAIAGGDDPGLSLTPGTFKIKVSDIVKIPRKNGRIAPAPCNMLKYAYDGSGDVTSLENWAFGADLSTDIISVAVTQSIIGEDLGYSQHIAVTQKPIESYDFSFVTEDLYESDVVGQLLNRFCYYAQSGEWTKAKQDTLAGIGIYIDPSQAVTAMQYPLVEGEDIAISYTAGVIAATWINNNLFSFIRNPFNAIFIDDATAVSESHVDLGLAAAFNLVGYQQIFWNEEALRVYTEKQKVQGRLLDNNIERAGNLILE